MAKGQIITLQFLIGIILSIAFLVVIISIIRTILTTGEDWDGSFNEFVGSVKAIQNDNPQASSSVLLKLEEDTAVIGLSPKVEGAPALVGDGDFHYMVNKDARDIIQGALSTTKDPMPLVTHFPRPESCSDDQSCICLCGNPYLSEITEDYLEGKEEWISDYYDKKGYITLFPAITLFDIDDIITYFGGEPLKAVDLSFLINCGTLSCEEVGTNSFFSPSRNDYFTQYFSEYDLSIRDQIGVIARGTDELESQYIDDTVENLVYDEEEKKSVPDYLFENGFAIYRNENSYDGLTIFGYPRKLPASVPVHIKKLSNSQIAVCLHSSCSSIMEIELAQYSFVPELDDPQSGIPLADGNPCSYDLEGISQGSQDIFDDIIEQLQYPLGDEVLILEHINDGLGLEPHLRFRIFSEESQLKVRVQYDCDVEDGIYQTETLELLTQYAVICGEDVDIIKESGSTLVLDHSNWNTAGDPVCLS